MNLKRQVRLFGLFFSLLTLFVLLIVPQTTIAHEAYVLDSTEVALAMQGSTLDVVDVIGDHLFDFILYFLGVVAVVLIVFKFSISRFAERAIDPAFFYIKHYSGHIAQLALGLALLASAYNGAVFGTELSLTNLFGNSANAIQILLYISGILIVTGIYTRAGALVCLFIFSILLLLKGAYMINYFTYFGEALVIFLLGASYSLHKVRRPIMSWYVEDLSGIKKHRYVILRISFGVSLIYAALYAKYWHYQLALETISKFNLTNYFSFDPLFLVLGVLCVELAIGLMFTLGIEIRFASIVFIGFLTASLLFFGESVWPHIILVGTALAMFVHGYDQYTLEGRWYKSGVREPVL